MYDSVNQIIAQYPYQAKRAQYYGYIQSDTPFYQALHEYYESDMPYEMVKGRVHYHYI